MKRVEKNFPGGNPSDLYCACAFHLIHNAFLVVCLYLTYEDIFPVLEFYRHCLTDDETRLEKPNASFNIIIWLPNILIMIVTITFDLLIYRHIKKLNVGIAQIEPIDSNKVW